MVEKTDTNMNKEKKIHTADTPAGEFYFSVVSDLGDAKLLRQLDDGAQRLISEVLRTGGKGKIVLSLTVAKRGGDRQVMITPAIKLEVPNDELRNRLLFADESGRLFQDDPAQGRLDFDTPRKVEVTGVEVSADAPKKVNH